MIKEEVRDGWRISFWFYWEVMGCGISREPKNRFLLNVKRVVKPGSSLQGNKIAGAAWNRG